LKSVNLRLIAILVICMAFSSCAAHMNESQKIELDGKEYSLRYKLEKMREVINKYTLKEGSPPQSLDDLVNENYIGEVPIDPITEKRDWQIIVGSSPTSSSNKRGIINIRSASSAKSSQGIPYNEW
jgi:general secretion pathway protein G